MRDINRIDPFLEEFKNLWKQVPDMRFGQLVYNLIFKLDQYNAEEEDWLDSINRFKEKLYDQSLLMENKFPEKEASVVDVSKLFDEIERLYNELISIIIDNNKIPSIEDIQWARKIIEKTKS